MTKLELEAALEDRCVAKVEARGGLALKLAPTGTRGFPDRTIFLSRVEHTVMEQPGTNGWKFATTGVFFAEFKRRKVGEVSAQQHRWRVLLHGMGYGFYTIDTDEQFDAAMERELSR